MDDDQHAADLARLLLRLPILAGRDDDRICHCGQEIQAGENHSMCWPGM
jgi:hypothetical protein